MSDNSEDSDDFDIYADLEENCDETDIDCMNSNIINKSLTDFDVNETETQNTRNSEKTIDTKSDNNSTNDLILSELTILEKSLNKTEDKNKCLQKEMNELRKQMELKDKQILVLKTNISSLYKTAKAEIDRKKQEMNGLREELDSLIFRRLPQNRYNSKPKTDPTLRQTTEDIVAKSGEQKLFSHKSTNTCDQDFRHIYSQNHNKYNNQKKTSDSSIRSPNEDSKSSQRSRRSRSRSRDRNRSRHRVNGERDPKISSKHRDEDKRRSGSKSRTDSKRLKTN